VVGGAPRIDDDLLAALGRYAPPRADRNRDALRPATPGAHRAPASPAPAPPPERSDSPFTPPDALTRRVKGAQLPQTAVVGLRSGRVQTGRRPSGTLTPGPSKATDVQTLLSNFTAGVQRGLAEARRGRPGGGGDADASSAADTGAERDRR
jgi:hypothetical protein